MRSVALAAVAFVVMEPVTAATHRFVMHGVGRCLHRSHHQARHDRLEANDAYPVMFASVVCVGLWVGFNVPGWADVVPVAAGVTAYGGAYALVHDVYIHRRLRRRGGPGGRRFWLLDRLAAAHAHHHHHGGAPFGMLLPILPARARGPRRDQAAGSRPSHVPELA